MANNILYLDCFGKEPSYMYMRSMSNFNIENYLYLPSLNAFISGALDIGVKVENFSTNTIEEEIIIRYKN